MKKLIVIAVLVLATVFFAGCNKTAVEPTEETTKPTEAVTTQGQISVDVATEARPTEEPTTEEPTTEEPTTEEPDDSSEIFGKLNNNFIFTSGVGAWSTVLNINSDGSFYGNFHDSNMGERGEGYPGGTVYYCDFTGQFGDVKKVNDYTYSMKMLNIEYKNEPDTEEIKNQQKFIYSTAYGLDDADELYIYTPDAPVSELPEEYINWIYELRSESRTTIGSYGIYNLNGKEGFIEHSN